MAGKLNYKDFLFSGREGETLIKEPGAINGQGFVIEDLKGCTVYLLDHAAQVTVDSCTNCTLHIGPVEGSIFLRDCSDCIITAACGQFRTKNCNNLQVFLFCSSDPSIEYSTNIYFAPYSFNYPSQASHFAKAGLDPNTDLWSQVFDFNANETEMHWALLPPEHFKEFSIDLPQYGLNENPVPRHISYGGTIISQLAIGSQQQSVQGLHAFSIQTSQQDAEKIISMAGSEGFEDMFSQVQPKSAGVVQPPAFVDESEFHSQGYQPPQMNFQQDFFGGYENTTFNQPQDVFGQPAQTQDFFGQIPSQPPQLEKSPEEEIDEEEAELLRIREIENQERMRKLDEKDREERRLKEERRQSAKAELQRWYNDRAKMLEAKKDYNREQEKDYHAKKQDFKTGNPWKKVGSMIDFKETTEKKAVTRMRQVLLAKKNEA
jgi:protein XRP2